MQLINRKASTKWSWTVIYVELGAKRQNFLDYAAKNVSTKSKPNSYSSRAIAKRRKILDMSLRGGKNFRLWIVFAFWAK